MREAEGIPMETPTRAQCALWRARCACWFALRRLFGDSPGISQSSDKWGPAALGGEAGPHSFSRYSTVTDFARLRGWSTSVPLKSAM